MKRSPLKRKTPLKRSTKPLKRTRLSPVSKKQQKRLRDYSAVRKDYLDEHPVCEACLQRPAEEIHHKEGRGSKTADPTTFMSICRRCHNWIHANPNRAREEGWLK